MLLLAHVATTSRTCSASAGLLVPDAGNSKVTTQWRALYPHASHDDTCASAQSDLAREIREPVTTETLKPHVEKAVFGFGIINPLTAIPQLYQVWIFKHVAGLSMITLSGALLMALLWTAYGILGRQTVIWATSAVWIAMNGLTLLGVALFS